MLSSGGSMIVIPNVSIPSEIEVAHKFGRETHVVNDAGIVFAQKPYFLVIMSKGVITREADDVIPTISDSVYQLWVGD